MMPCGARDFDIGCIRRRRKDFPEPVAPSGGEGASGSDGVSLEEVVCTRSDQRSRWAIVSSLESLGELSGRFPGGS